ncbi:signal peptidase I [Nitrososphaera sp.]|uniref:signal peptidase I n=1 Tax=Nitrososphaera sp. TaxID=1971748 RepID=UPI00307D6CB0
MESQKSRMPVAVRDIAIVVAGVAIVWLGLRLAFDTNNPFYVVSSQSMVPALQVNDVLVVRDGGSWEQLKIGDIIVFNRPDGEDRVIVHRVAEINDRGGDGERIIRTKGDANPASIPGTDYPITKENYIGKVVYVMPGAGVVTKIISPPVNYIIIAIILVMLFFTKVGRKKPDSTQQSASSGSTGSQPPPSSSSPPPSP